jgi:hypothetical protein
LVKASSFSFLFFWKTTLLCVNAFFYQWKPISKAMQQENMLNVKKRSKKIAVKKDVKVMNDLNEKI